MSEVNRVLVFKSNDAKKKKKIRKINPEILPQDSHQK